MSNRKGITPVIAIVLLLLITVGAVTVVYSQFQGIVADSDAQDQFQDQQQIQRASYQIIGVKSSDPNNPTNGDVVVTVKNTGDEVLDLTGIGTIHIGRDGDNPVATSVQNGNSCGPELGQIAAGETAECDTGVDWPTPDNPESTSIQLQIDGTVEDSYTCRAESGSRYC